MKLLLVFLLLAVTASAQFLNGTFPVGFQWGAATSAHQIEGAWNVNGTYYVV
jgi:hypothetical protein